MVFLYSHFSLEVQSVFRSTVCSMMHLSLPGLDNSTLERRRLHPFGYRDSEDRQCCSEFATGNVRRGYQDGLSDHILLGNNTIAMVEEIKCPGQIKCVLCEISRFRRSGGLHDEFLQSLSQHH